MTNSLPEHFRLPLINIAGFFALEHTGNNIEYECAASTLHLFNYKVCLLVNGEKYFLNPGGLALAPAHTGVHYSAEKPGEHFCFHFLFPDRQAEEQLVKKFQVFQPRKSFKQTAEIFKRIADNHYSESRWQRLKAASNLLSQVCELIQSVEEARQDKGRAHQAILELTEIINSRLSSSLRISELADEVGLDANYLARIFKKIHGKTIQQFIMKQRLSQASYWLTHTNSPIKSISADCGFYDVQHFYRAFKKEYNRLPLSLR